MRIRQTVLATMVGASLLAGPAALARQTITKRAFGQGKYGLELDNVKCGRVSGVLGSSGGKWTHVAFTHAARRHIGPLKYEEISFKCGTGMNRRVYDWIETGFNQTHNQEGKGRQNGAIVFGAAQLAFQGALVTELGMPALDVTARGVAQMTVKVRPSAPVAVARDGKRIGVPNRIGISHEATHSRGAIAAKKQKQWLPSNFRFTLPGVDGSQVRRIEALTIKQKVTENATGGRAATAEVPNLVITLPESHTKSLSEWKAEGKATTRAAKVEYLAADKKTVLFTVTSTCKAPTAFTPVSAGRVRAGADALRRIKVEMYCEDIRFSYAPAATFN